MTLHLKSRGYPFRPRLLFSSFIVVGVGFPTVYYFRRGQFGNSHVEIDFLKQAEERQVYRSRPLSLLRSLPYKGSVDFSLEAGHDSYRVVSRINLSLC